MAKRTLNGSHVRILLPTGRTGLSTNFLFELGIALKMGKASTKLLLKQQESVNEKIFSNNYDTLAFATDGNVACSHLLKSAFLSGLALEIQEESISQSIQVRNKFLVAAMAQRELTLGIWNLREEDIKKIPKWHSSIDVNPSWWKRHFYGALTVARLANLFLKAGADVRLSTPPEDVDWKIDLITSFPERSEGLCVQVKSNGSVDWINHRTFDPAEMEQLDENSQRLLTGVKLFQDQFRGIWTPIEIELGKTHFSGGLKPNGYLEEALYHILNHVLESGFERPNQVLANAS